MSLFGEAIEHVFECIAFGAVGAQFLNKLFERGAAVRQVTNVIEHSGIIQVLGSLARMLRHTAIIGTAPSCIISESDISCIYIYLAWMAPQFPCCLAYVPRFAGRLGQSRRLMTMGCGRLE